MKFSVSVSLFLILSSAQGVLYSNTFAKSTDSLIESLERKFAQVYSSQPENPKAIYYMFSEFENIKMKLAEVKRKHKYDPHLKYIFSNLYDLKKQQVNSSKNDFKTIKWHLDTINKALNTLLSGPKSVESDKSPFQSFRNKQQKNATIYTIAEWIEKKYDESHNQEEISVFRHDTERMFLESLALIFSLFAVINDMCALVFSPFCIILLITGSVTLVIWVAWLYNEMMGLSL